MDAAGSNESDILSLIQKYLALEKGCDLGMTALHFAAMDGSVKAGRALIEAGANINAPAQVRHDVKGNGEDCICICHETTGETPLHIAARGGNLPFVLMLVEKKADINAETRYGETPVDSVIETFRYFSERQASKTLLKKLIEVYNVLNNL
jgi:ankyrin repeat protein